MQLWCNFPKMCNWLPAFNTHTSGTVSQQFDCFDLKCNLHAFSSAIVSIKFRCIDFKQMCSVIRHITQAGLRLSGIYQHDSDIQCGSFMFTEQEILYLKVAARLFVNHDFTLFIPVKPQTLIIRYRLLFQQCLSL